MTRLRALLRRERGFTLIEMLGAATVGSVVMLATFSLLDTSLKQSSSVNGRIDSTQRGRVAMEAMTRELRSQVCFSPNGGVTPAVALTYADPYKIIFYAFQGSGTFRPDRRTLWWDTNTDSIKETVEPGVGTPVTSFGTGTTRTILTNVKPPPNGSTSGPVFTYTRTNGTALSATPLSAANLPLVGVINIGFKANTGVAESGQSSNTYTSYQSQVFVRTSDPNGLGGSTDPDCS